MHRTLTMLVVAAASWMPTTAQAHSPAVIVDGWYVRYLGRHGEPTGMHAHISALRSGVSALEVEAAFLASHEYFHRHGCSPEGFITGLFLDVNGCRPTHSQLRHWLIRLDRCGNRQLVALEFLRDYRPVVVVPSYRPTVIVPAPTYVVPTPVQASPSLSLSFRFGR